MTAAEGLRVDARLSGVETAEAEASAQEELGFDGTWVGETASDPFVVLGQALRSTCRLTLGTSVVVAFARSPMVTAMAAYDLQRLSGGRLTLGLGTQIRAHVERRFAMTWDRPAERIREYVLALRSIWKSWDDGAPLSFEGQFYRHTLSAPMFTPQPGPTPPPPVLLGAVGPRMARVAGEVADGVLLHGFTSEDYLRQVVLPALDEGLEASGRTRGDLTVVHPCYLATGEDEGELAAARAAIRAQLAYYGSTPAYRRVLAVHGVEDLQPELNRRCRQGDDDTIAEAFPDDLVERFAIVAHPAGIASAFTERFGDCVDRVRFTVPGRVSSNVWRTVLEEFANQRPLRPADSP